MRIFVTGGTGYIGSAVVEDLAESGHHVSALVRSDDGADTLRHLGADPVLGDLLDGESYREVAADQDALIHIAAAHGPDVAKADEIALDALLSAAETGRPRVVVYTSGVWVLGNTGDAPADETASTEGALPKVAWRPAHEQRVLRAANDSLATSVVRPGMVYGEKRGLVSRFFESAYQDGHAEFVGDGKNRWSFVHRQDLAEFYRLLVKREARGLFHAIDGNPVTVAEAATRASLAAGKGGKTRAIPVDRARESIGPLADALCLDQVVVSGRASELGWVPERSSFLDAADEAYREWRERNFVSLYAAKEPPNWEIGRPQRAFVDLTEAGRITGDVLDVGCGTGENTLHFAAHNHAVWGVDIARNAIEIARRKADERNISAEFTVKSGLALEGLGRTFDTVVDSGVFHIFNDQDRARYVENLRTVTAPTGTLFVLCFSTEEPGDWGPRRVSESELRQSFADWTIESITETHYENFRAPEGSHAWLLAASPRSPRP